MRIFLGLSVLLFAFMAKAETVDITLHAQFVFGKAEVTKQSQEVLDHLYQVMVDFPTAQALVTGHSDNIGNDYSNKFLSQKRALFISDYLIRRGIAPDRLISKGLGSTSPLASNATEKGREKNRRVDVEFSNLTYGMASALKETIGVLPTMASLKNSESSVFAHSYKDSGSYTNTSVKPKSFEYSYPTTGSMLDVDPLRRPSNAAIAATEEGTSGTPEKETTDTTTTQTATGGTSLATTTETPKEMPVRSTLVVTQDMVLPSSSSVLSDEERPFAKAGNFIRYSLGVGGYYNSLHVENQVGPGTADWISKINYNAELAIQWSLTRSKSTWMGVRFGGHKQDYEHNDSPSLYSWDGESPDLFRAALMFDFESSRFGFGLDFEINEEAFLYENAFLVTIEKNKLYGVSARLKYKILNESSHSSRLGLDVSYAVGGVEDAVKDIIKDTKMRDRISYVGYVDFRTTDMFKEHELGVKFYYGLRSFASEQNLQEEEIVGLLFTLYSPAWL